MTEPRPADLPGPLEFFARLRWIDGRPLLETIEPYRRTIFTDALGTFDADGWPVVNLCLAGRGKKNWKSADLIFAAFYKLFIPEAPQGNDGFVVANDLDQARDDLTLAKKLVEVNPALDAELDVQANELRRRDGGGTLKILPGRDIAGAHGKTFAFLGLDEIHAMRTWDLLEALSPDPTRRDVVVWVTTYETLHADPAMPLNALLRAGREGTDPGLYLSWYCADPDRCTDPEFAALETGEERANPSMASWANPGYLAQQQARLPRARYRRLHLNLGGQPEGAAFDAALIEAATVKGRRSLPPADGQRYVGFVDMSGGSADDATLGIAHRDADGGAVLDLVTDQGVRPPFNPRDAVRRFAALLKRYGVFSVTGDAYAGQTFRRDFEEHGIAYQVCDRPKSALYEAFEPRLNAVEVELLDQDKLTSQLLELVWRGRKIDHEPGGHDDWANAAAGAVAMCEAPVVQRRMLKIVA